MTESCESCRFWKQDQIGIINGGGKCRKNSPQICTDEYGTSVTDFPTTDINEWCGEWQENKVQPDFLSMPIGYLDLTTRTTSLLRVEDIFYIGDLIKKTESYLLDTDHLGKKSLQEIKQALAKINLELKPNGGNQ